MHYPIRIGHAPRNVHLCQSCNDRANLEVYNATRIVLCIFFNKCVQMLSADVYNAIVVRIYLYGAVTGINQHELYEIRNTQ